MDGGKIPLTGVRDLKQLESNLNDILMVAGSEAYVGALSYYNSVKYGARLNVADAKDIMKTSAKGLNGEATISRPAKRYPDV